MAFYSGRPSFLETKTLARNFHSKAVRNTTFSEFCVLPQTPIFLPLESRRNQRSMFSAPDGSQKSSSLGFLEEFQSPGKSRAANQESVSEPISAFQGERRRGRQGHRSVNQNQDSPNSAYQDRIRQNSTVTSVSDNLRESRHRNQPSSNPREETISKSSADAYDTQEDSIMRGPAPANSRCGERCESQFGQNNNRAAIQKDCAVNRTSDHWRWFDFARIAPTTGSRDRRLPRTVLEEHWNSQYK